MTTTEDLIDTLVERATPVRRLRPPLARAAVWLAFAGLLIAVIAAGSGVRPDLVQHLRRPAFVITLGGALTTGILAAVTAFAVSIPGRSRWWLALPLPTLAVWMATIGYGCLGDWVSLGATGVRLGDELRCLALLVMTGVPLAIALAAMLRYAAVLRPGVVATYGGLAIAAIVAAALPLFHNHDATALILAWNVGAAALLAGVAGLSGRRMLGWMAARLRGPGLS